MTDPDKTQTVKTALENPVSAAPGQETLLVVRKSFNALDFLDARSGARSATVEIGVAPHEVAVAPDGRRAVVSNYGSPDQPGSTLRIVDIARAAQTGVIDVGPYARPHGIAWLSSDRVAATVEGPPHLLIANVDAGHVEAAIETGQEMSHMVVADADGGRAYVANIRAGSVTAIDLVAARKLADIATGNGSEGLALTRDGRELWVCARAENRIAVVDARSLKILASIETPQMPIRVAMSPDGLIAYVTCAAAGALVAIDIAARKVAARHDVDLPLAPDAASRQFARLGPGSPLPIGITVSSLTGSIYVAATMADTVEVLDPVELNRIAAFGVGGEPDGITLWSAGSLA